MKLKTYGKKKTTLTEKEFGVRVDEIFSGHKWILHIVLELKQLKKEVGINFNKFALRNKTTRDFLSEKRVVEFMEKGSEIYGRELIMATTKKEELPCLACGKPTTNNCSECGGPLCADISDCPPCPCIKPA